MHISIYCISPMAGIIYHLYLIDTNYALHSQTARLNIVKAATRRGWSVDARALRIQMFPLMHGHV